MRTRRCLHRQVAAAHARVPQIHGRHPDGFRRSTPTREHPRSRQCTHASVRFRGAITIALAYGLRRGEALRLLWRNLDWEAGTLRAHARGEANQGSRQEQRSQKARLALGGAWQDHGLIFPSEVGTPTDPDNFSHTFSKLAQRAGLGHWHPHELRHSGASLMLAQGTPLHVVSGILGHAGLAITKGTYGHLIVDDKRAAAEAMSGVLFGG
ncbi:tyrosine-type recombinase/integrase [Actinomadura luteofluorescens]|uniref:tyrosine-type recombinase/integrase n=1 Tax=Actinomadura luteofluorescens TaxID=46163 RepID=UPI003D927C15